MRIALLSDIHGNAIALNAVRHPARTFIIRYMRGEYVKAWPLPQPQPIEMRNLCPTTNDA